MDTDSIEKSAFIIVKELFKWTRCLFEVMNELRHFQRHINIILYIAGLHADANYFVNNLGSGGAHYMDSTCRLDALL